MQFTALVTHTVRTLCLLELKFQHTVRAFRTSRCTQVGVPLFYFFFSPGRRTVKYRVHAENTNGVLKFQFKQAESSNGVSY